jgi:clan AA aspartic protease
MIRGRVVGQEAFVRLRVSGPGGRSRIVTAVVDTGYTESLSLTRETIDFLKLDWHSDNLALLADGSECLYNTFSAFVDWNGSQRKILVDESELDSMLGMSLLEDHELRVAVREGGPVTIRPLRRSRP